MDQSEGSFSNLLSVMYAWSTVVDFAKLSLVTQASFSEVKLANATIMSGALNALCIGKRPVRYERTDIARVNLNRLSLIISIFSDKLSDSANKEDGRAMAAAQSYRSFAAFLSSSDKDLDPQALRYPWTTRRFSHVSK